MILIWQGYVSDQQGVLNPMLLVILSEARISPNDQTPALAPDSLCHRSLLPTVIQGADDAHFFFLSASNSISLGSPVSAT